MVELVPLPQVPEPQVPALQPMNGTGVAVPVGISYLPTVELPPLPLSLELAVTVFPEVSLAVIVNVLSLGTEIT